MKTAETETERADDELLENLITTSEAAKLLGISPSSIRQQRFRGHCPLRAFRFHVGGRYHLRFDRRQLLELMEAEE